MTLEDRIDLLTKAITWRIHAAMSRREWQTLANLDDHIDDLLPSPAAGEYHLVRDRLLCQFWPHMKPKDNREMKLLHEHLIHEQLTRDIEHAEREKHRW